ncbi:T-cell activation inhibitor, mitochondrial isoform X2 [Cylas formicarius]|nr:T-cell activation inhibitor, mitochondrial isoform X2 [Cylas formicarius]
MFVRNLSAAEVSTALRPFYFSVHPDLFGQYPDERATNETSLQQLSSFLQKLQSSGYFKPVTLKFYVKNKEKKDSDESFRLIKIYLKEREIRAAILNILKSCNLSTDYLEKISKDPVEKAMSDTNKVKVNDIDLTKLNKNHPIFATMTMTQNIKKAQKELRLKNWLKKNFAMAITIYESGKPSRCEIERLRLDLIENLGLQNIKWECGWNNTHFRGCLLSFKSLVDQHPQHLHLLKERTLVFSYFTGISLDGHVMLFSGEVRHNWLDFIKNIPQHDASLKRLPIYEKTLSHVLRNIKVGRRKFMPKVMVEEYEKNLKQVTTALSDYSGHRPFPKSWPSSLDKFEIVVESEAGPMMVSPTGQFIVPSSIPGSLLVNFITNHLNEASQKMANYERDKYVERSLYKKCLEDLRLSALLKDDNITPELMIQCCQKLLHNKREISDYTSGIHLNIATYYSVLSDGVVCIPWNFEL